MPDLTLDLRFLRYAIVTAEYGSFRRAALVLGVPQSTVSRRVQLLEHRLGARLFERHHGGVRLTAGGEHFLKEAAAMARGVQRAADEMAAARKGEAGRLKIGLFTSISSGFLSELLAEFRVKYPAIKLILDEDTAEANIAGAISGRLDLAFVSGDPRAPNCTSKTFWQERIYVVMSSNHPLADQPTVCWDDIRHEDFIVSAGGPGPEIQDFLIKQLWAIGFRPSIVVHGVGRENLMGLVAKRSGLTLTTESSLGAIYRGATFRPLAEVSDTVVMSGIWSSSNENPALKRAIELCDRIADDRRRTARSRSNLGSGFITSS